jgi:hypothetical protein
MKNLNVNLSRTFLAGLMLVGIACGDKKNDNKSEAEGQKGHEMHHESMKHDGEMSHDKADHDKTASSEMTVAKSQTATAVIDQYLAVKTALVNDDSKAAAEAAKSFEKAVSSFDVENLESSKQDEVKEALNSIKTRAASISKMELAQQRADFAEINEHMKLLLRIAGSDRTLYEQYCPMYANDEGGFWLSDAKEIRNPLFGSQMLKCGAVKQSIVLQ